MNYLDWIVLVATVAFIVLYGAFRSRGSKDIDGYLKGGNSMRWWMIGISIMATQASAITFLSTPGQAIVDGMRFLQFYFGLPIAMVIISVTMVPIYYRLKVYTAYEYLESRFDVKTRIIAVFLFLMLRGLSAGITLFAPALVLSTILGWPVTFTTVLIGVLVIIYLVSGGSKAVSLTQRYQMAVIMGGMILAGVLAFKLLPDGVSFSDSVALAGELGKFNLISYEFDLETRYNVWSGLIAGTFLSLSYFGTDQSQVARYLGGTSERESKLGLIFNGLLKIPMQFVILFIGVMVYVFYLFNQPPVFHNRVLQERAMETEFRTELNEFNAAYNGIYADKRKAVDDLLDAVQTNDPVQTEQAKEAVMLLEAQEKSVRDSVKKTIKKAVPNAKENDTDYIFLNFVLSSLPHGIIGLLLAVMFSAAMSSMAGELNALASTSCIDIYKRGFRRNASPAHYVKASQWMTFGWAIIAMLFAMVARFSENLIQYVNIVGSLFYGTLLGIFLSAFYIPYVRGTAVFWAAIIAESVVLYCYRFTDIAFLLYNLIGCGVVIFVAIVVQYLINVSQRNDKPAN